MSSKILLFLVLSLHAQTITFDPSDQIAGHTIWSVDACLSSTAPATTLRGGDIYQMLILRGALPLPYSRALAVLSQVPAHSVAARVAKYAGWLAVTGGFLLNTDVVTASKKWRVGLEVGGAFLAVAIPAVRREVPPPSDAIARLLGPFLPVPAGGCASAVVLGGSGTAFKVVI